MNTTTRTPTIFARSAVSAVACAPPAPVSVGLDLAGAHPDKVQTIAKSGGLVDIESLLAKSLPSVDRFVPINDLKVSLTDPFVVIPSDHRAELLRYLSGDHLPTALPSEPMSTGSGLLWSLVGLYVGAAMGLFASFVTASQEETLGLATLFFSAVGVTAAIANWRPWQRDCLGKEVRQVLTSELSSAAAIRAAPFPWRGIQEKHHQNWDGVAARVPNSIVDALRIQIGLTGRLNVLIELPDPGTVVGTFMWNLSSCALRVDTEAPDLPQSEVIEPLVQAIAIATAKAIRKHEWASKAAGDAPKEQHPMKCRDSVATIDEAQHVTELLEMLDRLSKHPQLTDAEQSIRAARLAAQQLSRWARPATPTSSLSRLQRHRLPALLSATRSVTALQEISEVRCEQLCSALDLFSTAVANEAKRLENDRDLEADVQLAVVTNLLVNDV